MSPVSKYTFEDWHDDQMKDPAFAAAARELEPGYQIARLRIERGLTQAQLADLAGTKQPSIARVERGDVAPSLPFLKRLAEALGADLEIRIVPKSEQIS
jgi:transcriptional regulator with XRE-family HTH domain